MSGKLAYLLARLALILIGVFAAAVGLVLFPRTAGQPPAFLIPPKGCPAPCFMGVRPGVTPAEDAIALLEAQGWDGEIVPRSDFGTGFFIWNGQHPGVGKWASLRIEGNIVQFMAIPTRLALGDLLVFYGHVDWWSLNGSEAYAGYRQYRLAAGFPLHVRSFRTFRRFYFAPVTLYYSAGRSN